MVKSLESQRFQKKSHVVRADTCLLVCKHFDMPSCNIIWVKSELSFNHLDNNKTANINDLNGNYIHLISAVLTRSAARILTSYVKAETMFCSSSSNFMLEAVFSGFLSK